MSAPTTIARPRQALSSGRFQFSLVALLAATGWVALLCLALKTPTSFWCAALYLLAATVALTSILGMIFLPGASRAFAVGYCIFSFGYAGSLFVVEKDFSNNQYATESKLPTTRFAEWLFAQMHPASAGGLGGGGGFGGMGGGFGGGGMGPASGGMGGGGFFSVDSSNQAEAQESAAQESAEPEEPAAAQDPFGSADSVDPFGNGSMPGSGSGMPTGGMPGSSGMGSSMGGAGAFPVGPPTGAAAVPVFYRSEQFIAIVHSAISMLLGLLGGIVAKSFYARQEKPAAQPA